MAGRTVGSRFTRAYVDGYDLSGHARSVGELQWEYNQEEFTALSGAIVGAMPGQCNIAVGDINSVMATSTGSVTPHDVFKSASDAVRDVMIPLGIRAAPASGDPVFCAQVSQNAYKVDIDGDTITSLMDLGSQDARAGSTGHYDIPWGFVIHAKGAETTPNSGTADYTFGSQTLKGGYMMYQVFGGSTGTVTLKIQDSTGSGWSDLVSSGLLTQVAATGLSGIVALGSTGTVDTELRFQVALTSATTTTFALAFVRGR